MFIVRQLLSMSVFVCLKALYLWNKSNNHYFTNYIRIYKTAPCFFFFYIVNIKWKEIILTISPQLAELIVSFKN